MISLDAHCGDCATDNNSSSFQVKKFWSYIKAIKRDSISILSLIQNGDLLTEVPVKAFNAQFSSVFTIEHLNDFPDKGPSPYLAMPDLNITTEGISNLLANLNIHKAAGPDYVF